jgi:hypothetical protein
VTRRRLPPRVARLLDEFADEFRAARDVGGRRTMQGAARVPGAFDARPVQATRATERVHLAAVRGAQLAGPDVVLCSASQGRRMRGPRESV